MTNSLDPTVRGRVTGPQAYDAAHELIAFGLPALEGEELLDRPTVVIEVLSPITETHDRIRKWREYQTVASLQHFMLLAQSERRIEVYSRDRGS